jgi:hypothetical protein
MSLDHRAAFFLIASVMCLVMVPITPDEFVWVGYSLAVTYVILAVLSGLDHWSRRRSDRG